MLKKLKNEIRVIKWANGKLVLKDMGIILSCSAVFMAVIGAIEWLGKVALNFMV